LLIVQTTFIKEESMGLRSWLTPLQEPGDWDFFQRAIEINPDGYGVSYVLDVTEPIPGLSEGLWVAWSGDGSGSLTEYMPGKFIEASRLLDNILETTPGFKDPTKYGRLVGSPDEVEPLLTARAPTWEEQLERL
jgi:hypothetical protein